MTELERVQAENAALRQQVVRTQGILQQRARANFGELIDALNVTLIGARAGDQGCRADLQSLVEVMAGIEGAFTRGEDGQRQWSGIVLANGHVPPN